MVAVHMDAFPDGFLTHLGGELLRRYYACYLDNLAAVTLVAESGGEVGAFAVGTWREEDVLTGFYQANLWYLLWSTLRKTLMLDPVIVAGLRSRMGRIRIATSTYLTKFRKREPSKSEVVDDLGVGQVGTLVSIATSPSRQGSSISRDILAGFEGALRRNGTREARLSVLSENGRAIAFYLKCGWKITETRPHSLIMSKALVSN